MKLNKCLDETLCGMLMMKLTASEDHEEIQLKIKGSLFGDETRKEHKFYGAACLSKENILDNSKGIIEVSLSLDELDITQGKAFFTITENDNGIISATFTRWSLESINESME